jgi:alkylhydroperoxidase family enzyme
MREGVTEELYAHVASYRDYEGFSEKEKLAIEYAERFAMDHLSIDDSFLAGLREKFSDEEILDLSICVATFVGLGRLTKILGLDQGCAVEP